MTSPRELDALMSQSLLDPTDSAGVRIGCLDFDSDGAPIKYDLALRVLCDPDSLSGNRVSVGGWSERKTEWALILDMPDGGDFQPRRACLSAGGLQMPLTVSGNAYAVDRLRRLWAVYEHGVATREAAASCRAVRFAVIPALISHLHGPVADLELASAGDEGLCPKALGLLFLDRDRRIASEPDQEMPEPAIVARNPDALDLSSKRLGLLFLGRRRRRFGR